MLSLGVTRLFEGQIGMEQIGLDRWADIGIEYWSRSYLLAVDVRLAGRLLKYYFEVEMAMVSSM